VVIEDCTFWHHALDASAATYAPGGNAYAMNLTGGTLQGTTVRNSGLYRGLLASGWYYLGAGNSVSLQSLRQNWWVSYSTRSTAPVWEWNAVGDFEGWTNRNEWEGSAVSNGAFTGAASGNDPFAESPAVWINPLRTTSKVRLRMQTTGGPYGILFFTTEADPAWDLVKAVSFPTLPDGNWHDYVVDLGTSPGYAGVLTRLRVDPCELTGAEFGLDFIRLRPDPGYGTLKLAGLGDFGARIRYQGDPRITWRVLTSSNMMSWVPITSLTADAAGLLEFTDGSDKGSLQQFYQLTWP